MAMEDGLKIKFSEDVYSNNSELANTVRGWFRRMNEMQGFKPEPREEVEEKPYPQIEDLIKNDEYSMLVDQTDDKKVKKGKFFSTGVKKNGKVDLAFVFEGEKATIFRNCTMTMGAMTQDKEGIKQDYNIECQLPVAKADGLVP